LSGRCFRCGSLEHRIAECSKTRTPLSGCVLTGSNTVDCSINVSDGLVPVVDIFDNDLCVEQSGVPDDYFLESSMPNKTLVHDISCLSSLSVCSSPLSGDSARSFIDYTLIDSGCGNSTSLECKSLIDVSGVHSDETSSEYSKISKLGSETFGEYAMRLQALSWLKFKRKSKKNIKRLRSKFLATISEEEVDEVSDMADEFIDLRMAESKISGDWSTFLHEVIVGKRGDRPYYSDVHHLLDC
jgi:hypothetical protein